MTDEPVPLPVAEREIDAAIEAAFDQNGTVPAARGEMFAFERSKADVEITSADPIVRIEQKLDVVIRSLAALKSRVESIDTILARLIHR
jgi:hypothetical protein